MSTDIEINKIRRDGGTQSRANINTDVVNDYAERMRDGIVFPPVTLFYDGKAYWLADGFHRVAAADAAGLSAISADVRQGAQRDAILHSVGVNAAHGLRRTNDDKRRAVEVLLRDKEWRLWSDREIARQAGVDHKTVGRWRGELVASGEIPQTIAPASIAKSMARVDPDATPQEGVDTQYSPEIADNADVEGARQIAIKALELWTATNELEQVLTLKTEGDFNGAFYRIGKGQLADVQGELHEVGASHIAVALVTNNGARVYRFDARQLYAWIEQRAAFVKSADIIEGLYQLFVGASYTGLGWDVGKKAKRLGLFIDTATKTMLTTYAMELVRDHLTKNPKLTMEHQIRIKSKCHGRLGEGIKCVEEIYNAQKKIGNWVGIVPSWNNETQRQWADAFVNTGVLIAEYRDYTSRYKANEKMRFYAVTEAGVDLIGRNRLPMPPNLPEQIYNADASVFVPPDAEFKVKVGDIVQRGKEIGRVDDLQEWPRLRVRLNGYTDVWYENEVKTVDSDKGSHDPIVLAELDSATKSVWSWAKTLLETIDRWKIDEIEGDENNGLSPKLGALESLANLMRWVSDTNSGQRLKLELPKELLEELA